jgi:N-acyl-D-amino-acid deacylase
MPDFDVLIRSAKVVDGTGNPWFYGDVALSGDRVAEVTPAERIPPVQARKVVDATGMVVCPGFIDIQSHSILPLMADGRSLSKIAQGVTTKIMGESWTPAPFGGKIDEPLKHSLFKQTAPEWEDRVRTWHRFRDWLEAIIAHGVSPNIGAFLGGGTLRMYAKGFEMGPPSDEELATMRRVMDKAMQDGAFGVSYALIYPPDAYTSTDELVEICQVVSEYAGLYITHMRSEADQLIEGVEEALEIGRRANLPVEIYHLKAAGKRNWPKMAEVIALIDKARAEGLDVAANMYPYTASGTGLMSVLPPWTAAGGKFFENLRDPEMRARIRAEALNPSGDWEAFVDLCTPEGVMPIGFEKPENQPYVGKRLSEIAAMREQEWIDTVFDLFVSEEQRISTIYFMMQEENLELKLQQPWIKISTDAGGFDPAWARELAPTTPVPTAPIRASWASMCVRKKCSLSKTPSAK